MKHKIKIGKPVTKGGEIFEYEDVREIASNQIFNWNRRGYKAIPEDAENQAEEAPAPAEKKASNKKASNKNASK